MATIPADGWRVGVGGLQITEDGDFELVMVEEFEDGRIAVTYGVYSNRGVELFSQDLTDKINTAAGFVQIEKVVFTDDGYKAILVRGIPENDLYLINNEGALIGHLKLNINEDITKLRDGRVVISQYEGFHFTDGITNLRVIDFTTAERDETIPVMISNARQLHSAGINQPYDVLMSDGRHLYGYTVETDTVTPLLDWMEVGVIATFSHHIGVMPDDRIVILSTEFIPVGSDNEWYTDFYILTQTSRAELPEKTIITVGGFYGFYDILRPEIIAFNRENQYYQIELLPKLYTEGRFCCVHGKNKEQIFKIYIIVVCCCDKTDEPSPCLHVLDIVRGKADLHQLSECDIMTIISIKNLICLSLGYWRFYV